MTRIHVFTSDIVPGPQRATSGGGLRSGQIVESLRRAGMDVTYSLPGGTPLVDQFASTLTADERRLVYQPVYFPDGPYRDQGEILDELRPDIAIWCNLNTYALTPLHRLDCIKICDLHGPVTIEQVYLTDRPADETTRTAIQHIAEFDLLTTPSNWQRFFWAALAMVAGFDPDRIVVVPVAFDVAGEPRTAEGEVVFCTAGSFLPWQAPFTALCAVAEALEEAGQGQLRVTGTAHDIAGKDTIVRQLEELGRYKRVKLLGLLPGSSVDAEIARASFAVELMEKTLERELAFSTRHAYYLSRGLPIITSNYSYLDNLIREHDCGYSVDPKDGRAIRCIVMEAIKGKNELLPRKSKNCLEVARNLLAPEKAIEPVVEFCRRPSRRASSLSARVRSTNGKPGLRVLGVTGDPWALRYLRLIEPLKSLRMNDLIGGFTVVAPEAGEIRVVGPELLDSYDVLVVQREIATAPVGRALIELFDRYVLDIDDHMLAKAAHRSAALAGSEFVDALREATSITVSTKRLCKLLEKAAGVELRTRAYLAPNGIRYPEGGRSTPERPRGLIWTSSDFAALTTSADAILRATNEICHKYDVAVHCIGVFSQELRQRLVAGRNLGRMSFWEHKAFLASSPPLVALCPLETVADRETLDFVAGKSDLKMIEYGGFGHPGVYSAAPPYTDTDVTTGIVAKNGYGEWRDALEALLCERYQSSVDEMHEIRRTRHIDVVAEKYWYEGIAAAAAQKPVTGSAVEATVEALRRAERGEL